MFRRNQTRVIQPDLPKTVEAAQVGGEGYQKDFGAASIRERRLTAALRAVSVCLFLAIILNLVQGFLMVSLFPLKEVRPFIVQVAQEGSIVAAVRPIQETFEAADLLTEKLVREYVVVRNEILRSDAVMTYRWNSRGYLGSTTEPTEYGRFIERVTPQLEEIRKEDGEIRVDILSVNAIRAGKVYVVDYRLKTFDRDDKVIDERTYTATLDIEFRTLTDRTRDELLINPTGFTVLSQTIAEKTQ